MSNYNSTTKCPNQEDTFLVHQTIYFVRHGTAQHNVMQLVDGIHQHPNLKDPKFTDSRLISHGRAQAQDAANAMKTELIEPRNVVAISSPLTRCLETMNILASELGFRGTWIVREELREAYGIHYSDKRSKKSVLQLEWPHVDFRQITSEEDDAWKTNSRETLGDVTARVDDFLRWLSWNHFSTCYIQHRNKVHVASPRTSYMIVTHGVWLECFLRKYFPTSLEGGRRVHNCDVFRAKMEHIWVRQHESRWCCDSLKISELHLVHGKHNHG